MHGRPAERTQADGQQAFYSDMAGIDFTGTTDMTRQEGKTEADINVLMKRFAATGQIELKRDPKYQMIDYTIDLQTGLDAIAQAKQFQEALPEPLRAKYKTWRSVLQGIATGELEKNINELKAASTPKTKPPETPPIVTPPA